VMTGLKTAEGLQVAPDRADATSSMTIEFGDGRCEHVADRISRGRERNEAASDSSSIKRSGGVRLAPVDGRLAFFRTIECDCVQ